MPQYLVTPLGVSVRVFLEDVSVELVDWVEGMAVPRGHRHHPCPPMMGTQIGQKGRGRVN